LLPDRSQYVVNTSEYEDIRERLVEYMQFHKISPDPAKPTLLRPADHVK
jgi:hypothetical protein